MANLLQANDPPYSIQYQVDCAISTMVGIQ